MRRTGPGMLGLVATIVAASCDARADGGSPITLERSAAAEALFRDGRGLAEAGDDARACPFFAESFRLDPALGTLLNLATCEENTGKLASAWEHYGELLDRSADDDPRHAIALQRKAVLVRQLPWLTITLARAPAGTRVVHDGMELSTPSLGMPLPVDPGAHEVVVLAPGHVVRTYDIHVGRGERAALTVEPGAPTAAPSHTAGYVVLGSGMAAIAVGAALGVSALESKAS